MPTDRVQLSRWDQLLISAFSRWGLERGSRAAAALMARHDAAGGGRRRAGWFRSSSDANEASRAALLSLREISRDLRRNNGWARRGIQAIGDNTIGWGI